MAQSQRAEAKASGAPASAQAGNVASATSELSRDRSYRAFLARLQVAVRADDRRAVVGLIDFPLRVNFQAGARSYGDVRSVEREFERIFTPRVRQAILNQQPDQLFVRDQGAVIGNGEVRFDFACKRAPCSPADPVRIEAINP